MIHIVLILQGEILSWSFMGVEVLKLILEYYKDTTNERL